MGIGASTPLVFTELTGESRPRTFEQGLYFPATGIVLESAVTRNATIPIQDAPNRSPVQAVHESWGSTASRGKSGSTNN